MHHPPPPSLALASLRQDDGRALLERTRVVGGKIRERREKVQEAEGKTVGRSAGNYVGNVIG